MLLDFISSWGRCTVGDVSVPGVSGSMDKAESLAILAWKSTRVALIVPLSFSPLSFGVGFSLVFGPLTIFSTGAEVSTEGKRLQPVKVTAMIKMIVSEIIFVVTRHHSSTSRGLNEPEKTFVRNCYTTGMDLSKLKVAIVHDYLNAWGGAEAVVAAIHELFPRSPVYTSLYDPLLKNKVPAMLSWKVISPDWLQGKLLLIFPKYITFIFPWVFESFDLSSYDLVISSSAAFAKGVLTVPETLHINYCHTPPRFLYGYPGETDKRTKWYWQLILRPLDSYLRLWDYQAMQRPNNIVCNSQNVADRIRKFYRREATVIYPPIDIPSASGSSFPSASSRTVIASEPAKKRSNLDEIAAVAPLLRNDETSIKPYFLVVSRLSAFKNVNLAIEACGRLNLPLKVAGTGRDEGKLRELAKSYPSVEMLGFVEDKDLPDLYAGALALIYSTVDEDFGMSLVEANGWGKPVIALRSGGHVEAIKEGFTGEFFETPTVAALSEKLINFKDDHYSSEECYNWAAKFSKERFLKEFREFIEKAWTGFQAKRQ